MKLQEGTHEVTCSTCGASGRIRIRNRAGQVRVDDDSVQHLETCIHFKRDQPRHLQQRAWVGQERRANALVGAFATPASGAVGEDGDGRLFHQWRVETKGTAGFFYTLTQAVWSKLVTGALRAGEEPLLFVRLASPKPDVVVVIRKDLYDGWGGPEAAPAERPRRILPAIRPYLVGVDPVGVALSEELFQEISKDL